jgi:hypothetical protein
VSWTIGFIFILLALVTPILPDYQAYQDMYESQGGHLSYIGRDPGFVLLIQLLAPALIYSQFRLLMIAVTGTLTILALRNMQAVSSQRFGMSLLLALLPLIFLKFGVQVREGIALSLWIFVIFGSARRMNPFLFVALAALSISIHLATTPLWLLLFLAYYLHPHWPSTALLLGALVFATFIYFVADITRYDNEFFGGLSQELVAPNVFTAFYWLIFPTVFVLSLLLRDFRIRRHSFATLQLQSLGFVVKAGMIGFIVGVMIQILITGSVLLQKGLISDIMRIASLILILQSIFLVINGKNKKAVFIALFLCVDTARIIMAA